MKTLISFKASKDFDCYKGTRLRKTLKGACEISGITWVDSLLASPDIIHLISPDVDVRLRSSETDNYRVVVSCGYCEGDTRAHFFEEGPDGPSLRSKPFHLLNHSNLILVPNKEIEYLLRFQGINADIKVLQSGVNLSRFDSLSLAETMAFYRYYRVHENDPFVITVGDLDNAKSIETLAKIANYIPKIKIFGFANRANDGGFARKMKSISKKLPKNLTLTGLAEDDVYRSAICNALAYIRLDRPYSECMTILEAFAAKTNVVYLGGNRFDQDLLRKDTSFGARDEKEVADLIASMSLKPNNNTIMQAYALARENSLPNFASKLKQIYQELLATEAKL
ncbi:MAG: glycosyltransferase [Bacillota bacterium]|nr:glycosyltransferase [Bacillota bacterium]